MKSKISCWRLVRSTMISRLLGGSCGTLKRTRVRQGSVRRGRNATRPHDPALARVIPDMQTTISSPVGDLRLTVADDGAVTSVAFGGGETNDDPRFGPLVTQLREYFAGERTAFD